MDTKKGTSTEVPFALVVGFDKSSLAVCIHNQVNRTNAVTLVYIAFATGNYLAVHSAKPPTPISLPVLIEFVFQ